MPVAVLDRVIGLQDQGDQDFMRLKKDDHGKRIAGSRVYSWTTSIGGDQLLKSAYS